MQALRLAAPVLAFATVLSAFFLALGLAARTAGDALRLTSSDYEPAAAAGASRGGPENRILAAPAEDAAGAPIPGLPRYPGSVRLAYAEGRADGLSVVRARFATKKKPAAVRDFYGGIFRAENWGVANVEYAGGEWYFLAARGGREVVVEVGPRGGGSLVKIEASRPAAQEGGASAGGASAGGSKR